MGDVISVKCSSNSPVHGEANTQKQILGALISHFVGMVHSDLEDALWNTPYAFETDRTFESMKAASVMNTFWDEFQTVLARHGVRADTVGDIIDFFGWSESDLIPLKGTQGKIETGSILLALEHLNQHLYSGG